MRLSRVKVSFDIVPAGMFWNPKWPWRSTRVGITVLPANLLFNRVWERYSAAPAFLMEAAFAAAAGLMLLVLPLQKSDAPKAAVG